MVMVGQLATAVGYPQFIGTNVISPQYNFTSFHSNRIHLKLKYKTDNIKLNFNRKGNFI